MDMEFGKQFLDKTSKYNLSEASVRKGEPQPAPMLRTSENAVIISLPEPDYFEDIDVNFLELVEMRTSVRQYAQQSQLTMQELSYLLWCTQGVKMITPDGSKTLRNVPSAGARHALETYLLINRVEDIQPGLYRFMPLEHSLEQITVDGERISQLLQAVGQTMLSTCAVGFLWTAVLERMSYLFAERAYRYLYLDAGHICQNLYLAAQTVNYGCCAIGGFDDEQLNKALGIDGVSQFAVYGAAVGR